MKELTYVAIGVVIGVFILAAILVRLDKRTGAHQTGRFILILGTKILSVLLWGATILFLWLVLKEMMHLALTTIAVLVMIIGTVTIALILFGAGAALWDWLNDQYLVSYKRVRAPGPGGKNNYRGVIAIFMTILIPLVIVGIYNVISATAHDECHSSIHGRTQVTICDSACPAEDPCYVPDFETQRDLPFHGMTR